MPFWAARISSGSAARRASAAAARLPEAIASSTLRTKVRTRERRERLIAVRFAILRVIFLADTVLAMGSSSSLAHPMHERRPEAAAGDRGLANGNRRARGRRGLEWAGL